METQNVELEQKYEALFELEELGFWEYDIPSERLFWSKITKEIHGVNMDYEPQLDTAIEFYKEGYSRDRIQEVVEAAIKTGEQYDEELILVTQKGKEIWVAARMKAVLEKGVCTKIFGTFRDITTRKKLQQQLAQSEERFRGAFESSAIGMAIISPEGHWVQVNKSLTEIVGYSEQELLKLTFQDITHPDDLEADLGLVKQMLDKEIDTYQMEKRYFHKNGSIVWILLSVSLVWSASGEPLHFVSQIENITERKEAEQEAREAVERLKMATQAAKMGVWQFDIASNNLIWNDEMFELYGLDKDHFSADYASWSNHLHPDDKSFAEDSLRLAIEEGVDFNLEFRICTAEGQIKYIKAAALINRDENGNALKIFGTNWDITQDKENEKQLIKIAALESKSNEMEQFAYVASHDLREPVLTMQNYLKIIFEDHESSLPDQVKQYMNSVNNSLARMDSLISGLLEYSRLQIPDKIEAIDVNKLVQTVCEDLSALINKTETQIVMENLPDVFGYPLQLKLLFQNLLSNAIKFRKADIKPKVIIRSIKVKYGWEFSVEDNGIGIHEKDMKAIFTIFKKLHNKKDFEGTGIGLAHVAKIAELHNGEVWVESVVGAYSSFHFTILTEKTYEEKAKENSSD